MSGKDASVCLPTGSGKSLCNVLLPLVFNKLTCDHRKPQWTSSFIVVVSPLIALMRDQVDNFKKKTGSEVCTSALPMKKQIICAVR